MNKTNFAALFSFICFLTSSISLHAHDPRVELEERESFRSSKHPADSRKPMKLIRSTANPSLMPSPQGEFEKEEALNRKYQQKLVQFTQRLEDARHSFEEALNKPNRLQGVYKNLCHQLKKALLYIKWCAQKEDDIVLQIARANLVLLISDIFRDNANCFSFNKRDFYSDPMLQGLMYFCSEDEELSMIGKNILENLMLTRAPLYEEMVIASWNTRENDDLVHQINRANLVLLISDIFRDNANCFSFNKRDFYSVPMLQGLMYFCTADEELSAIGKSIIRTLLITGASLYDNMAISFVEEHFMSTQPKALAARLKILLFLMYQRRPITKHTSEELQVIRRERDERITALIQNILNAPEKLKRSLVPLFGEMAITFVETHYTTTQPEVLRVVLKVLIRIMCQRHLITDDTPEELRTIKRAKDERISSLIDNILKTHRHVKRAIQPLIIKIQEEDARYHAGHAFYA